MKLNKEYKPVSITFETQSEYTAFALMVDYIESDPDILDEFRETAREVSNLITNEGA